MATTNTLTGSSQADILNAPGSSVTLVEGLAGNDTITLSKINDEAKGGEGADSIVHSPTSGASNVIVDAGDGNDTLYVRSASSFGGTVQMGAGADSVAIGSNSNILVSNAFIRGGTGNDTLVIANTLTSSTVGGGSGADLMQFTFNNTITSSLIIGGQKQDSIHFAGTGSLTSTSVNGGKGKDTIRLVGASVSSSAIVGGGKGEDSISVNTAAHTNTSVSGGAHADTITLVSALGASMHIYGDTVGETTTSTDAAADYIHGTAGALGTAAISVYGGGGNDTVAFFAGGSQTMINGGDGADSIRIFSSSGATSINGGAGNDTIRMRSSGDITIANFSQTATLNGGEGTDVIATGSNLSVMSSVNGVSFTAGHMVVAYGAGDVIDLGTTLATTQSNWAAGSMYHASGGTATIWSQIATAAGAASLTTVGDMVVWSDNTDSYIGIATAANGQSNVFMIKITGKDLTTTTLTGAQALKAANFGFDVDYGASAAGLKITLT